ncbi:hypothetical protein FKG94_19655 [Exilibacterium tricleocarpae]|uniref:Uncharacterized protein n=1 Tax=Exilibacterium tricleocarpae TaxID=2591008 RepID=A0A545T2A3_9GAMM|nr:hypothetical protein [Exilibacterium tricleocarpae]TQV71332.1 hypothetical protein FKG94_19655 [Exilibacterium tricleocarpae]
MIEFRYQEERAVALYFAELLGDAKASDLLETGVVSTSEDATHLSKFFWAMVNKSAAEKAKGKNIKLPCEGSSEYWTEKLYNSIGGYLESVGFGKEWDTEVDNA